MTSPVTGLLEGRGFRLLRKGQDGSRGGVPSRTRRDRQIRGKRYRREDEELTAEDREQIRHVIDPSERSEDRSRTSSLPRVS